MACSMDELADKFDTEVTLAEDKHQAQGKVRHCAFCLISIPSEKILLCGQCRRRAYCSKKCQKADWSPEGKGQGHKIWCPLQCGEEDLDWEVAPVAGKGLGLIAKRALPSKFRIMVDAARGKDHSGIEDLMPEGGTIKEKIRLNCLGGEKKRFLKDDIEAEDVICLRIARANHNCDSNANYVSDGDLKVKILFAERDIKEGEEICIQYLSFNAVSQISRIYSDSDSDDLVRKQLETNWGIVCPQDCFCRNTEIKKLVEKSRELDKSIVRLALSGYEKMAAKNVKKLLKNHDKIHSSWLVKKRTLYDGFQVGILRIENVNVGKEYAKQLYEGYSSILSPDSKQLREYADWMTNPENHYNYLNRYNTGCLVM